MRPTPSRSTGPISAGFAGHFTQPTAAATERQTHRSELSYLPRSAHSRTRPTLNRRHPVSELRAIALFSVVTTTSVALTAGGCSEIDCSETLTCPQPNNPDAGDGGGAGGSGGSAGSVASPDDAGDSDGNAGGTAGDSGVPNGSGGSAGSTQSDGGDAGSTAPDTKPPTILSVSPADGAKGVAADAQIVITFSEPMDTVATQAAYQSADIPASQATFTWNANGTVLIVKPKAPLAYATGTTTSLAARKYVFSLSTIAMDRAGNRLAQKSLGFSTLRRLTQTFRNPLAESVGTSGIVSNACSDTPELIIGDSVSSGGWKFFLKFDLASLPSGITTFESATLNGTQGGVTGSHLARRTLAISTSSILSFRS